jgi:hypothetical protein
VKALIDNLFKVKSGETSSTWNLLKREPKKPTNKETRSYLQHIRRLQLLVDQLPTPIFPFRNSSSTATSPVRWMRQKWRN